MSAFLRGLCDLGKKVISSERFAKLEKRQFAARPLSKQTSSESGMERSGGAVTACLLSGPKRMSCEANQSERLTLHGHREHLAFGFVLRGLPRCACLHRCARAAKDRSDCRSPHRRDTDGPCKLDRAQVLFGPSTGRHQPRRSAQEQRPKRNAPARYSDSVQWRDAIALWRPW
jgi:hypothetical protein